MENELYKTVGFPWLILNIVSVGYPSPVSSSLPFLSGLALRAPGRRRVRPLSFPGGRFFGERSPAASRSAGSAALCMPPLAETPVLGAGRRRLSALGKPGALGGGP